MTELYDAEEEGGVSYHYEEENGGGNDEDEEEEEQVIEGVEGASQCLICWTEDLPAERAIAPCGHDDFCAQCHLRLRRLHKDRKCPICKTENQMIVVDSDLAVQQEEDEEGGEDNEEGGEGTTTLWIHKPYEDYEIFGNSLGSNYTFREDLGMFFPNEFYNECVLPLFSLRCGVPGCQFTNETDTFVSTAEEEEKEGGNNNSQKKGNKKGGEKKRLGGMKALNEHLKHKHNLTLCHLCVDAKRDFVSQLPRFNPNQLRKHLAYGDGETSGFKGHPLCQFCKPKRFYDITKLHEHLNKQHYKCHVCERQGLHNQFFKNYDQLNVHFDREHYLCHEPQCLEARFVVFANEIDLRSHELEVHGGSLKNKNNSTKIQIGFRVRRPGYDGEGVPSSQDAPPSEEDFQYGLDGQPFVPESLPSQSAGTVLTLRQENEPILLDPVHAARTAELRSQAQQVRLQQQQAQQEEMFPALQSTTTGPAGTTTAGARLSGWTGQQVRAGRGGTSGNTKTLTSEDFPSLGPSSRPASSTWRVATGRGSRLRSTGGASGAAAWGSSSAASNGTGKRVVAAVPRGKGPVGYHPVQTTGAATSSAAMTQRTAALSLTSMNDFPSLGGGTTYNNSGSRPAITTTTSRYAAASQYSTQRAAAMGGRPGTMTKVPSLTKKAAPSLSNSNDFPSLGGGTGRAPTLSNSSDFPSLGGGGKKGGAAGRAPALSNSNDFPSLGGPTVAGKRPTPKKSPTTTASTSTTSRYSAAQKFTEQQQQRQTQHQTDAGSTGALSLSTSSTTAEEQVETIKAMLGNSKYKRLRNLTKDFAQGKSTADQFVDGAASLFDGGAANTHFQTFVPHLIESVPNDTLSKKRALSYISNLVSQSSSNPRAGATGTRAAEAFPTLSSTSKSSAPQYLKLTNATPARTTPAKNSNSGKTAWGTKGSPANIAVTAPTKARSSPTAIGSNNNKKKGNRN